jgi:hypothetical protein
MSTINTNGINVNYPVPGVNNNSQGFRDNFASIKTNLDQAATEITDLQNNVVVKNALTNTVVNNDMGNTLISNAATRGFRATTYNLGNDISGTLSIDVSLGDVQYGTIAGNTVLQFRSWAPTGTQSNVQLLLSVSNSSAAISFPTALPISSDSGATTLENFSNVGGIPTVTVPYGVTELDYRISTIDCGTTLSIEPINRPTQSTQIQVRTPASTGFLGDVQGDVCVDANYLYVATGNFNSAVVGPKTSVSSSSVTNELVLNNLTSLVANAPIVFTGTPFGGLVANQVYYIKSIVGGNTSITLSATRSSGTAGSTLALTTATPAIGTNMYATSYNGTDIWKRIALTSF